MEVFIKATEFLEIPVRRSDDEPLHKLFMAVRSELNMDLKNMKKEQAKFWKKHLAHVKTELLIQSHLTRQTANLSPDLEQDCKRMLEITPRLLEEMIKMAIIPHTSKRHGWLRPAVGVSELSQCVVQFGSAHGDLHEDWSWRSPCDTVIGHGDLHVTWRSPCDMDIEHGDLHVT